MPGARIISEFSAFKLSKIGLCFLISNKDEMVMEIRQQHQDFVSFAGTSFPNPRCLQSFPPYETFSHYIEE